MKDKDDSDRSIDAVSDQERDIALTALQDFKKRNYNGCLQSLHKLEGRTYDFKVDLNKAVVEFCKSDCKKIDAFEKAVQNVFTNFQIRIEKLDEVDYCVAHYNQAIISFHKRQYTSTLRILDRVYKFIEPMEEELAKQVILLFIELQLCLKMPDKVMNLITYSENHIINPQKATKKGGSDSSTGEKDGSSKNDKNQTMDKSLDDFKKKIQRYKARCYILKHNLSSALKELQFLGKEKTNIELAFLQANIEYLKGNLNDSLKILSSISIDSLAYDQCGESSVIMIYNNLGILHHAMGKPNLACHYFQKALKEDISIQNMQNNCGDKALYTLGGSKYHELMYNLGISLLHSGKANQAFDCLIIAVRRYHRNSRLWMRLAECCIMLHKPTNEVDFDVAQKQKEFVARIIGNREKQKLILTSNLCKDKKYSPEGQSYAVPVPTLEFATICLRNAFVLIPSDAATTPVPLFLIPGVSPPAPPPSPGIAPSAPLSNDERTVLRNGILAASAYVALCIGDYIIGLEHARNLLSQPKLSDAHRLLGHLYAAEALVLLDKISEALDHLNPDNVKSISLEFPLEKPKSKDEILIKSNPPSKWCPNNLTSAHAVLQYNIAVAKTIRGQFDQAQSLLKQVWKLRSSSDNIKVPAQILMLVIYIELQLGHADIARSLIKQYSIPNRISG